MSSRNEMDYDRQFQDDLEKATALSLETLALEQFRRNKSGFSDVTDNAAYREASPPLYSTVMGSRPRPGSFSNTVQHSSSTGSLAPPPIVPPRRHSEVRVLDAQQQQQPQTAAKNEPDLISFTSPTQSASATAQQPDPHSKFVQMVDQLHNFNAQLQVVRPAYGFQPQMMPAGNSNASAAGLQLVPYTQQQQSAQKVPLTAEQLDKLYNMNYAAPQQHHHPQQVVAPPAGFTTVPITSQQQQQQQHNMQGYRQPMAAGFYQYGFNVQQTPPAHLEQRTFGQTVQQQPNTTFQHNMTFGQAQQQQHAHAVASTTVMTVAVPDSSLILPQPVIAGSMPKSQIQSGGGVIPASASALSYSSGVVRRNKKMVGDDLIDLENGEDNSRVSVLQAFDPFLEHSDDDDDKDGANSDCAASYYSEYDPFDYLYSTSTQYSDPVYEAVNKIDRTPLSPGAPSIGWNIPTTANASWSHYSGAGSVASLATVNDTPVTEFSIGTLRQPPPLPPRNTNAILSILQSGQHQQQQQQASSGRRAPTKLYENVIISKSYDGELRAFYNMVKELRARYVYSDRDTNVGHVVAAEFDSQYSDEISIKLLVHPALQCLRDGAEQYSSGGAHSSTYGREVSIEGTSLNNGKGQIEGYGPPVVFTCDISTTVEHVITHVFCQLEGQVKGSVNDFMLKPIGVTEWMAPSSKLSQLLCIHDSIKMEKDVQLGLCPKTLENLHGIARTHQDDVRDAELKIEDILTHEPCSTINYESLMILLETLEDEIAKLEMNANDAGPHTVISCSGVVQPVKMICALLNSIDTLDITDAIDELKNASLNGQTVYSYTKSNSFSSKLDIVSESGDYAEVKLRPKTTCEQISYRCNRIRDAVQNLIEMYSQAFRVDFCVNTPEYYLNLAPVSISNVLEPVMVHIMCLHRTPQHWKHDDYMLGAQIYHGTRYIGDAAVTQCSNEISGMFSRLKFDSWLHFEGIPICTLPRESRLVFVLYGCTTEPTEGSGDNTNNSTEPERKVTKIELGWCSMQFFDFERNMVQGNYLLSLWPPTTDKFLGPAPAKGTHPKNDCSLLGIEIPNYGARIVFPEPLQNSPPAPKLDFNCLDRNLQQELIDTAEQGYPSALEKREVLWEKRYYLHAFPHALPKVLHAAHSWDFASLVDLHALIKTWQPLSPLQALELLLPRYPDLEVRAQAVHWLSAMRSDQLVDFLPQLLQSLKHDTYEASPMAQFLLCRALESPRIAHHLYWLLMHSLPGDSPQNTIEQMPQELEETLTTQARYHRRNQMMLRALLATCGEKLSGRFLAQNMMCNSLSDVAQTVKQCKESLRQKMLVQGIDGVNQIIGERRTSLPLGPEFEVVGINARNCSYFNSYTLPLKLNFIGPDGGLLPAIFKCGDDLQQDMLTIQLVRIMDKLWLKEGLDLKMVTFNCVPTGHKKGMIELVSEAETLRKIQVEWGLTGSFKDKPIAEWLAKQNPSQLEYQRAVYNFTVSCAGYSVATYILGICDRHNDNIMLKTSGHLFHIDFGKFLGDAQMFGNFKRDRTPFVLTSDMAYVINGGDRPSTKFHHFVDLCCTAFNIVRKHGDLLLHMLALMATSGIPGVTADAVNYVRKALLPGQSNPEAAASFAKMIHISMKSWFTQFNFFLHNLAQMRFSGEEDSGELLSFVPRTYTMAQDGRLEMVAVHGYQKRYDLEKYYTYILRVKRQNQPDVAYLFRSYKEFLEFHQKLCLHFPLAKLHSLPSGIHVGRSNIKTVAERRLPEIRHFLTTLFNSTDEIAHSVLVYTFFHPLLRDQQEANINVTKVKDVKPVNSTERVCGEIKLSLQYHRGALTVMIHHARSLPQTLGGQEPNTYVKCYLKPDPKKATKRKTKVVRKNCFPSFMETLEYRMPIEYIQNRVLQVTVWSHDSLQENEFLGGIELALVDLDLREEHINWFKLDYLPRA